MVERIKIDLPVEPLLQLVEAVAGQDFDLLAGETAPGCGLVETSGLSLYGDAFHNRILGIKKSRSSAERDPSCFHSIVLYS